MALLEQAGERGWSQRLAEILDAACSLTVYRSAAGASLPDELAEAGERAPRRGPAVVFLVSDQPRDRLLGAISRLRSLAPGLPIVLVREPESPSEIIDLLRSGVADFLIPPIRESEVLARLWRVTGDRGDGDPVIQRVKERLGLRQLVGESPAFLAAIERIPVFAACDAPVLIVGETGTGKDLCARAIHYLGARSPKPFVPLNCGAVPLELIENELFGHRQAAFTGATVSQPGLVAEAEEGTLFLDEIDCLPPHAQVKLLRFLQDGEYRPLGSSRTVRADVRLISASNSDVEEALREGRLRRDLYYRLDVLRLELPPLRDRSDDVILLARHFLAERARVHGRPEPELGPLAVQALRRHDWPGNVRELEHVIERAVVLCTEGVIRDLPELADGDLSEDGVEPFRKAKARTVAEFEQSYVETLLEAHHGNVSRAARAAGKNRRAFWELVRKHGVDVDRFRD